MPTEPLNTGAVVAAALKVRNLKERRGVARREVDAADSALRGVQDELADAERELARVIASGIDEGWL